MMIESKHEDVGRDVAALVGRVLMSAIFVWSGFTKLTAAAWFQGYLASLGVPFPEPAWAAAVAIELVGGLALLLGMQARAAAAVLGVWCIVTALIGHTNFADVDARIHFMKNVAMAGGFLFIATFGAGAYSLDRLRLRLRAAYLGRLSHW